MPRIVCFANMKGGVGKTTLCTNLAFEVLWKMRKSVLVVDIDPQFNATSALMDPTVYIENCLTRRTTLTTYELHEKPPRVRGVTRRQADPRKFFYTRWQWETEPRASLDLIPSRIELFETLRNPSQKEQLLNRFLQRHASKYDYIFIDCPPTPGVLTLSAFTASHYVVIPVTPDYFATLGLPQFLGILHDFKEELYDPNDITPLGVVFTRVPRVTSPTTEDAIAKVRDTLAKFKAALPVFGTSMTELKVYAKALWKSRPVQLISGRGVRGRAMARIEMAALSQELVQKDGGT